VCVLDRNIERNRDNTIVVTNNLSGYPDLSGVMQMETHPRDITMKHLVQRHHERLKETGKTLFVFTSESIVENYQLIEQIRVGGLVRNGGHRSFEPRRS